MRMTWAGYVVERKGHQLASCSFLILIMLCSYTLFNYTQIKGDKCDCPNFRDVRCKVPGEIPVKRIRQGTINKRMSCDEQGGFRGGKGCITIHM